MVKIVVGSRGISTGDFVNGSLNSVSTGVLLDSKIKKDPELVLKFLWEKGIHKRYRVKCLECINRMYECGKCNKETKHLLEKVFN